MADADLTLDGVNAIVDGNALKVRCWDIMLDGPGRRSSATGHRRALVHGFNDELVVNWAGDYPGGITLTGAVAIPGRIKQAHLQLESHDLHLDHPARRSSASGMRRALVHGFNDELVINWAKDYPGATAVHGNLEVQKSGTFRLRNNAGNPVAELNPSGDLLLGGNGVDGDVVCRDTAGANSIQLDGGNRRVDMRDAGGALRVRVDTAHFTSAPWPAWPGEAAATRLDVIAEIRRLKQEVVALKAEVAALVTP